MLGYFKLHGKLGSESVPGHQVWPLGCRGLPRGLAAARVPSAAPAPHQRHQRCHLCPSPPCKPGPLRQLSCLLSKTRGCSAPLQAMATGGSSMNKVKFWSVTPSSSCACCTLLQRFTACWEIRRYQAGCTPRPYNGIHRTWYVCGPKSMPHTCHLLRARSEGGGMPQLWKRWRH